MAAEIVVIVASIAFGLVILIARPRVTHPARSAADLFAWAGRSIAAGLQALTRPRSVVTILGVMAFGLLCLGFRPAPLLLLIVGAAFVVAWFRDLLLLMSLRDDELPGRYDKPIWAFLLIALPPVGLIAFRCQRAATARLQPTYHPASPEPKPTGDYARELA